MLHSQGGSVMCDHTCAHHGDVQVSPGIAVNNSRVSGPSSHSHRGCLKYGWGEEGGNSNNINKFKEKKKKGKVSRTLLAH